MRWMLYRWVWRLRSPLHIGHTPAGTLNRARLYIPARNLWAALTAEIARQHAGSSFPDYKDIGQELQEHVRFTYLFPAEWVGDRWYAWLPRYEEEKGLYWHREDGPKTSDRRFRWRLLHTRPGTAMAAGTGAAEEGTLREVEYIATHWKAPKASRPAPSSVAFVGYVFLKSTLSQVLEQALRDIRELFIGGETRYGFGHLVLQPESEQEPWALARDCFDYSVNLTKETPVVVSPSHLLAHGILPNHEPGILPNHKGKGDREALFHWDWQTPQTTNQIYWLPGTQISGHVEFLVRRDGIWEGRPVR